MPKNTVIDMRPLDLRLRRIYKAARDNRVGIIDLEAGLQAVYWEGVRVGSESPDSSTTTTGEQ